MKNKYIKLFIAFLAFVVFTYFSFKNGFNTGTLMMWSVVALIGIYGQYRHYVSNNKVVYDEFDKKLHVYASSKTLPYALIIWMFTSLLREQERLSLDMMLGMGMIAVFIVYVVWVILLKRNGFPSE